MFPRVTQLAKKLLKDEAGVTAIEYCVLFTSVSALIVIGGLMGLGPEISRQFGNSFNPSVTETSTPNAGETESGGCPAHSSGVTGNCGVGLGGGGGNGTPNEGNGKGPGADKEKFGNPGKGHS